MTFHRFNRRLHLYLGLALLPWFFMYGVSSVPFTHNQYFQQRDAAKGLPLWTVRAQGTLDIPIPDDNNQLREFAAAVLARTGVKPATFGAYRSAPDRVTVFNSSFLNAEQIVCSAADNTFSVQQRRFRWDQFLTGMHARGGFVQDSVLRDSWSVVVDIVCIGFFLWITSGLYMWWGLPGDRSWGWLAILAGVLSFAWFTFVL